ncbi:MAG: V-type ATP synthase subunit I [Candidatus Omnitrophica bacterium]|nr:V-type ATP synthase subunit I [Candidatus Omnitrophota bacterium]MDD5351647.1 V-type ATP synthase subunit I [Candidatus Omnitrophota bacterium]MDD5550857.1 V-type ATP synthase subunit I [Candidatus Omnitrophota bacterium]
MAIAKIKKLEIIGLLKDKESVLDLLQRLAVVQLLEAEKPDTAATSAAPGSDVNLLEIEESVSYLATFQEKAGMFGNMVKFKPTLYKQKLREVMDNFDYRTFLGELSKLRNHLKNLLQHREHLMQEKHMLAPWIKLKIPLEGLHSTESCGILLGLLRTDDYENLSNNCKKEKIDLFCEAVSQDEASTHLIIFYIKEQFEKIEAILKNHHFNFVTLARHKGTAEERLFEINREVMILDDQLEDTKDTIRKLSQQMFKLMVVYDYFSRIKNIKEAGRDLATQQFTFMLKGWVKHRDISLLEKEINSDTKDMAVFISEPKPGEEVPVDLENPPLIQPFEFITKIYGAPKYGEIDPTPYLAPFFFLYFGFCVSDAGYGFVLALFCLFILKKLKMGPQGLRFFKLFFLCGISTIIVGALTGSWFGNLFDLLADGNKSFLPLKQFKDALIMLDPLKEPTKLLAIALSFGIVQVWFGNIVAAIGNIKNKRYLDVALDQVSMLTLLFGLTGLGLVFLKLLGNTHIALFKYAASAGALALILTQGRSEKGWGSKLFYGGYNLYSALSGYLSDILSYSRLWALGLVTGVMANTINLISIQFSQIFTSIVPFIDKLGFIKVLVSSFILVVIFLCGHLVSFLMNLLGAFVHPLRLQFVEFFSKFFKSGGVSFRPFKVQTKYINFN